MIRIGTRGSALALAQTNMVKSALEEKWPEHVFEIVVIKTTGDMKQNKPIGQLGTKGVFVKEIEEQLLSDDIDIAVHSMKDMPGEQPDGLMIAPACFREDPHDALILREKKSLEELPNGAVIGTGSMRRILQLRKMRPDITCVGIRGNIDTRIRKMETEKLDGIILAAAGLKRLGLSDRISQYLDTSIMIPAAAQGALAIEMRTDRVDMLDLLNPYRDSGKENTVAAEREFLRLMNGGCEAPVGAHCVMTSEGEYSLRAMYAEADGSNPVFVEIVSKDPKSAAEQAAVIVREQRGIF